MADIKHLLDDIRKDKYCQEMRETFCNALIETNKAAEEIESTVKKIKNEITSVNANAEVIDARCGEENLGDFNRKISSQLDTNTEQITNNYNETFNQIRTNTSYRLYSLPVVTIIADDGNSEFLTLVKPIFDEYSIKASIGVIPGKVGTDGYMSLEQLKELQSNGYSMLSHSFTHSQNIYKPAVVDKNPISDDVILEDYRKCYEYMVNNNFNGADTIVYPWGYFTDSNRYKNLARTYFNNGVNAYGGNTDSLNTYGNGVNEEINDNMYLNR